MALHDVLCVGLLCEETQEGAVLVGGSLEMGAQEPVDGPHELDLELGRKQAFKALLNGGVF